MERTTIGLLGALGGLAAAAPATSLAEPAPLPQAANYAELLAPVEAPAAILRAHDALLARARAEAPPARLDLVDHHHHHHHHAYRRYRYYQHHHHHHHHHGYYGYYGYYGTYPQPDWR
ncbi:MAG TPA: hypothetical protein PLV07_07280 [Acidiphilium sp.]|uniref:hypothetical protein n=1 Tax=unclassified Acidiphilium TaxID=2617493 RepID=UPI000BD8194D|nr:MULTISPECIES: hypothetical protein [unclassified Acidiphilium]OYV57388.1 MAG: hypothetical protein B7Z76_01025 [Acidiphilium sp. 20-67-58]HQT59753.1 hypothetical protein [Acidiphilium sp.]HQU11370.1 hypothetical protein [Acidiphilium sp.]